MRPVSCRQRDLITVRPSHNTCCNEHIKSWFKQQHTKSTDLHQGESVPDSGVLIQTPDPQHFQNVVGVFLVNRDIYNKIFMKIPTVFVEMWAKLWKMTYLAILQNPLKNSLISIQSRWLPTFKQFLLVQRCSSHKIFVKISSVVFTWRC